KVLKPVGQMFRELSETAEERDITAIFDDIMEQSGYMNMLLTQGEEGQTRIENIKELKSSMITFTEENENASLFDFLQQVALISDLDSYDSTSDRVSLMTMHAAKGLEFERVFIVGAEENIFPSYRSLADAFELEEDRRLCYVAITRAKRELFITTAQSRLLYGQTQHNRVSRFVGEIPSEYIEYEDKTRNMREGGYSKPRTADSGYLQRHTAPKSEETAEVQSFSAGERIHHRTFGDGTVLTAMPLGNDTLLEISFDTSGTKKLMAKFAKISKI
ncbi:MAG: 3'-5' exonuclease, partial [Ruminiclostridium sp.]